MDGLLFQEVVALDQYAKIGDKFGDFERGRRGGNGIGIGGEWRGVFSAEFRGDGTAKVQGVEKWYRD